MLLVKAISSISLIFCLLPDVSQVLGLPAAYAMLVPKL